MATNTVELTDDFESLNSNSNESGQRTRFNSGVYVKIVHTAAQSPVQTETPVASPLTDTSEKEN